MTASVNLKPLTKNNFANHNFLLSQNWSQHSTCNAKGPGSHIHTISGELTKLFFPLTGFGQSDFNNYYSFQTWSNMH